MTGSSSQKLLLEKGYGFIEIPANGKPSFSIVTSLSALEWNEALLVITACNANATGRASESGKR